MLLNINKAKNIKVGKYRGALPTSWNELPLPKLLACFSALLAAGYETGLEAAEVVPYHRISMLCALLDMPVTYLQEWEQDRIAEYEGDEETGLLAFLLEVQEILNQIDFCYEIVDQDEDQEAESAPINYRINLGLTRNPYPVMQMPGRSKKGGKVVYHGPGDGLKNLKIHEIGFLFTAMDAYTEKRTNENLNRVLATVYRRKKTTTNELKMAGYHGDLRRPLFEHEHQIEERMPIMGKIPIVIRQLLWFYLVSCRQQIVTNPAFSVLFERQLGEPQRDENMYGWAETLLHLAGDSVVNLAAVASTPWQNAFVQLALEKKRAIEHNRKTRTA